MLGRTTLALALLLIGAVAAAAQSGGTHNLVFTVKDLVFKVEDLMRVRETPTEVRIELPADILFDFDKFDIRPSAQIALQQAGQMVRTQAKGTVRIEGHTDAKGAPAYNQTLSTRRAQSVQTWLVEREGLKGVAFTARGFAATRPAAPNTLPGGADNPDGRQKNRRVEIVYGRR